MYSQTYYLVRSRQNGQYLQARPDEEQRLSYVLAFQEQYEALTYLNTHAREVADRFGVESLAASQLQEVLNRWEFNGIALVRDPVEPQVEFLSRT